MDYRNVIEHSPVVDSIIICPEAGLFGSEKTVPGWFRNFATFAGRQDHSMFKTRTEAMCGLAYNTQQSADRMDFPFTAFSLGLSFWGPPMAQIATFYPVESPSTTLEQFHAWFMSELPNHIGVEFKIGPDIILTDTAMAIPPGYGPAGDGVADGDLAVGAADDQFVNDNMACMFSFISQGQPQKHNRFSWPEGLAIPVGANIECKLLLSDYARYIMLQYLGPNSLELTNYAYNSEGVEVVPADQKQFPARFGITASLWGLREVQQRGALHQN